MLLVEQVMDDFLKSKNQQIDVLSQIAKRVFTSAPYPVHENSLEIVVAAYEDNKSVVYHICPTDNFDAQRNILFSPSDCAIFTGGIKTEQSFNVAHEGYMNNLSLSQIFQNVFDSISFEGVGGNLEVYKIDSTGANLFYKNKINENNIKFITIDLLTEHFEKHFIIAERLFGRIITGERVIVGDPDGILEIRGNKGVVTDRNGREVMWFGLFDTNPDRFGLKLENDTNQVIVDRDEGFVITRKKNGVWDKIIWLDLEGFIHAKGLKLHGAKSEIILDAEEGIIDLRPLEGYLGQEIRLSIDDGITVTRPNINKIWLSANKGIAVQKYEDGSWKDVFFVDLNGNVVMNDATINNIIAKSLTIENDDGLVTLKPEEGLVVIRKDNKAKTVLNATDGIYIETDSEFGRDRVFGVDMQGILYAKHMRTHSLEIFSNEHDNKILIDADKRILNLENFDMIIGSLEAQNVISTFFDVDYGAINDLTVNRLKTVQRGMLGVVDFIDIHDKYMNWVTAVATESTTQATDRHGRPLFWIDASKSRVTTEDTGNPVYLIDYNTERYEKFKMYFVGTGYDSYPKMEWGVGSGSGDAEKGYIYKEKGNMIIQYNASVQTGAGKRLLQLGDNELTILSERPNGTCKITLDNNGNIVLEHSSGSSITIGQNIFIKASGNLKLEGQRIDLN